MRKIILLIGVVALIVGFAASVSAEQQSQTKAAKVKEWDLSTAPTLMPTNSTFYATLMNPSRWFELDVSSSDIIEFGISVQSQIGKTQIWGPQVSTKFEGQVTIAQTGTYVVDIKNVSPSTVTLEGNVTVEELQTSYNTIYPYAFVGVPLLIAGIIAVIFGFREPKRLSSSKRKTRKD